MASIVDVHLLSRTGAWPAYRIGATLWLSECSGGTFSSDLQLSQNSIMPTTASANLHHLPQQPVQTVAPGKNEIVAKSKLPIPISLPEKTSSKIKATLKNLIMSQQVSPDEKLPPEPRMTRSSSLRRANSLKRFNNRNHGSVTSANGTNTCGHAIITSPGKVSIYIIRVKRLICQYL